MLNFILRPDDTLSFELNRYKMLNAGLKVSADILVLGGSELDIASVLKEQNEHLTSTQAKLKLQSDKLATLEGEINRRENQLSTQQIKLTQQTQQLKQQSDELQVNKARFNKLKQDHSQLSDELTNSRQQLSENTSNLNDLKNEIEEKEGVIGNLSTQIDQRKADLQVLLLKQQQQIAAKESEISSNLAAIEKQSSVIRTQSSVLMWAAVGFAFVLLLIIIIWQVSRAKHNANLALQAHNQQLAGLNQQLKTTQNQLVESEKMAALGGLVAGVAHEINTPLGVSITAASHLLEQIESFDHQYAKNKGKLTRGALESLLLNAKESSEMISRNLDRASHLVGTFKQVAVDQSSEAMRRFELEAYLKELTQSLRPQLKQGGHQILIKATHSFELNSYPGVFAQVMTNLIMNSVNHGFKNRNDGLITIALSESQEQVLIDYQDNGEGLNTEQINKVFEPFYTTARSSGGTGLGMSISYNLVVSKLNGMIHCLDSQAGAHFQVILPLT